MLLFPRGSASDEFGALLRRHRRAAGLTQERLAALASCSVRALSDLERGVTRWPQRETVRLLADALALAGAERAAFLAAALERGPARPPPPVASGRVTAGAPSPAVPDTPLIGREGEVADALALLRRPEARLLTLTGPGGVGKTRLALRVAADLGAAFPDGVVFVPLAPLDDPALVLPVIARSVGVRESGGMPLRQALHASLRARRLLLVLDNCEHLLAAAPDVAALLSAAPRLAILATSRAPLRLRCEQEYPVGPLAIPPPASAATAVEVAASPAAQLFAARARAVAPGFALSDANAAAVAALCRRLDGLPLALELAAAWLRLLPPAALLARLDRALPLLAGGARDLPARQRTLRDTIAWSYDLLDEGERALFRRLAVFAGGTLEAIEAIGTGAGDPPVDLLAGVDSLVRQSLVRTEEGEGGEVRVGMLETIREYAAERLAASGEGEAVRRAHAAHYLALAEAADRELAGPRQAAWLARLEAEHDNLRAALRWALEGDLPTGFRLAGALWVFWWQRGHLSEGRRWLEALLARGGAQPASLRAPALLGLGALARSQGDPQAAHVLSESAALCREAGDTRGLAMSLVFQGSVVTHQGDYALAQERFEEALALFRGIGDVQGIAAVLRGLGAAAQLRGDYARARELFAESLALSRQLGDTRGIAEALYFSGNLAMYMGDYASAGALLAESLGLYRELASREGVALVLRALGLAALNQGDHARALPLLEESLAVSRVLGNAYFWHNLIDLGNVLVEQGEYARAGALLAEGLALARAAGNKRPMIYGLEGVAGLVGRQGGATRAARLYGAAAALRDAIGAPLPPGDRARNERNIAVARTGLGEPAWAAAWAEGRALPTEAAIAEALEVVRPTGG